MFRIEDHHEAAVIEMGMNHFGELDRIATAVRPHIGVISNVGVAHIGFLGSREGILKAKCEMLDHLEKDGVAILNADNDMLQTLEGKLPHAIKWFGVENKRDFYADEIEVVGLEQTKCTLHTPIGAVSVVIPVPGEHMVLNALSAAAVGVELGLTLDEIKAGIDSFVPTKKRMTLMKDVNGITILNDSYNANPVSMKSALDVLSNAEGRKVAVLGTMGELEDYAPAMHREVGAYAAEKGTDVLICIGKWNDCMEAGAKEGGMTEVYRFDTQEEFWENGLSLIEKGDNVLVKASLSTGLSRTVDKLQGVN